MSTKHNTRSRLGGRWLRWLLAFPLLVAVPETAAQAPGEAAAGGGAPAEWGLGVTVVEGEELERLGVHSLAEVLGGQVPGAYSMDMGIRNDLERTIRLRGPMGLSICAALPSSRDWRGLACPGPVGLATCGTCGPRILVDGVEVVPEAVGSLSVLDLERIIVVRGPKAALRYGADAASGVIELLTRKASAEAGRRVRGTATIGTVSSPYVDEDPLAQAYTGSVSGSYAPFGFSVAAERTTYGGHVPAYERWSNALAFGFEGNLSRVRISGFGRLAERRLVPPGWAAVYYELYADGVLPSWGSSISDRARADYRNLTVGVAADYRHGPRWRTRLAVGSDVLDLSSRSLPTLTPGDSMILLETERYSVPSVRLTTRAELPLGGELSGFVEAGADRRAQRRLGYDTFHRHTDEPRVIHSQGDVLEENFATGGGFVAGTLRHRLGLEGTLGMRADRHTFFGGTAADRWFTSPLASLGWELEAPRGWRLRPAFTWARGNSVPNRFMLSGRSPDIAANPDLEPQVVEGWELGTTLATADGRLLLTALHFDQTTTGVLGALGQVPGAAAPAFVNSPGRITNAGQELSLLWSGGSWEVRGALARFTNEVSGVDGAPEGQPVSDETFPEMLAWGEGRLSLERWLGRPAYVGGRATRVGRRWATDRRAIVEALERNEERFGAHRWFAAINRLDVFAGGRLLGPLHLLVEANNLGNDLTPETPEHVVPGRELRIRVSVEP